MSANLKKNRPDRLETLRDNAKFLANKYADAYRDGNEPLLKELDQAIPDVYAEAMRLLPRDVARMWKPPDGKPDFPGIDTPERAKLSPGHAERAWKEIAEEAGKALADVKAAAAQGAAEEGEQEGKRADEKTCAEWARTEDVSPGTLSKAAKKPAEHPNHLPSRKVGRNRYVREKDFWAWYKNFEARRVYALLDALLDADREQEARQELVEIIARMGGNVTVRELMQANRKRFPTAEAAQEALDDLADGGDGKWRDEPSGKKGGRPTQRFYLGDSESVFDNRGR